MHLTAENPRYSMQGNSTHPHSDFYEHLEPSISDDIRVRYYFSSNTFKLDSGRKLCKEYIFINSYNTDEAFHLVFDISDESIQSLSRQECTRFIPWITRTGMSPRTQRPRLPAHVLSTSISRYFEYRFPEDVHIYCYGSLDREILETALASDYLITDFAQQVPPPTLDFPSSTLFTHNCCGAHFYQAVPSTMSKILCSGIKVRQLKLAVLNEIEGIVD